MLEVSELRVFGGLKFVDVGPAVFMQWDAGSMDWPHLGSNLSA